ncbi:TPA: four helix bundle protein [archaeon]|nr:four helix bundle protein [Candidatus Naiadarchaeales archaeon SRR2090153.bin461]HIK02231.1 four helix bundle protein [Candidatus Naiadarchaeales archaeon SRR2090159.bin1288]
MQDYKNLEVYNEAKKLALEIYRITLNFPREEIFGIVQQLRRAALSVGANIAEGSGRKSNSDFLRFLHNSMGSLKEIEHFLVISSELNYLKQIEFMSLHNRLEKVSKMLNSFMQKVAAATNH